MATTSLWHIKGRLKDLIDYVENPAKTVPKGTEDFFNVFSYIQNPQKTADGSFVTAINCLKQTALRQMILVKQRYGKEDKYIAWHGYQSFQPGEVTPEVCHEIGVKLANEMWGGRFQIIVTTHLDKGHLHNHFCFNSVSFRDGKKYNYSKAERHRLRDVSDRLCREYGLSVIKNARRAPSRPVWQDEQSGKPTRYNIYREDIQDAIFYSNGIRDFERYLKQKGYEVDLHGAHWRIKLPQYKHFTRMDTLDKRWTPQGIFDEIDRTYHRNGSTPAQVSTSPYMPEEYQAFYIPFQKTDKIYRLYLYYCYQLGILPKHTDYKPDSPYLKEDLRKLDEISNQTIYMAREKIETLDDLLLDREFLQDKMEEFTTERRHLQNKIRRASPAEKEKLREEKRIVTERITICRKRLKLNYGIEERSIKIQETMDLVYANEERNKQVRRDRKKEDKER